MMKRSLPQKKAVPHAVRDVRPSCAPALWAKTSFCENEIMGMLKNEQKSVGWIVAYGSWFVDNSDAEDLRQVVQV